MACRELENAYRLWLRIVILFLHLGSLSDAVCVLRLCIMKPCWLIVYAILQLYFDTNIWIFFGLQAHRYEFVWPVTQTELCITAVDVSSTINQILHAVMQIYRSMLRICCIVLKLPICVWTVINMWSRIAYYVHIFENFMMWHVLRSP